MIPPLMSADKYSICPRCQKNADVELEKRVAKAAKAYGTVSADEFITMAQEARTVKPLEARLRQDWEIGVDENHFSADFRCSCSVCRFEFKFKHEAKIHD